MNIKAIIASTMLTVLFSTLIATTSANAGDNDYLTTAAVNTTTEPFVIKHAFLLTKTVESVETEEALSK